MAQHTGSVEWFNMATDYGSLGCNGHSTRFVYYGTIMQALLKASNRGLLWTSTLFKAKRVS